LKIIKDKGFGADCVSGGEVQAALDAGITADKIVFAGVGKADWEINLGIDQEIFCFNVESLPELETIHELAAQKNKIAKVALRINPDVQAKTHAYITTGLEENKFGISLSELDEVLQKVKILRNIDLIGMHVHIGSQITDMSPYADMCVKINELQLYFEYKGFKLKHINVGGGLGVNYEQPDAHLIPDFESYFRVFREKLNLRSGQIVHFELGRSIVAQCGSLISKVLYIKKGSTKQYVILDAGMTELIRPALYQAYHHIQNLFSGLPAQTYDVVGPICESTDVFATDYRLPETKRGDLIAIRSAGAYGETMASRYNLRNLPASYTSDEVRG
jgi:diaminopimelate decarboxylase